MSPDLFFLYIMAKGNMLLGYARGKVGSLVFSRVDGKQVTRARAEVVKNPKTTAQMVQRIVLNTCAQAYSLMQPIVDHSFEGVQVGQRSMSEFMKENLNLLRSALATAGNLSVVPPQFSPIGSGIFANNAFIVSKGSLPVIKLRSVAADGVVTDFSGNTYNSLVAAQGLKRGDQITFIAIVGASTSDVAMRYARIIADPRNTDGTAAEMSEQLIVNGVINKPNPKNESYGISFVLDGTRLKFTCEDPIIAACVIVSRQSDNGSWLRSKASLNVVTGAGFGKSMQACLDLLQSSNVDVENPLYLNNAGVGGSSPEPVEMVTISASNTGSSLAAITGLGSYPKGSDVTLSFNESGDLTFESWKKNSATGDVLSSSNPYTFTANEDLVIYADYSQE